MGLPLLMLRDTLHEPVTKGRADRLAPARRIAFPVYSLRGGGSRRGSAYLAAGLADAGDEIVLITELNPTRLVSAAAIGSPGLHRHSGHRLMLMFFGPKWEAAATMAAVLALFGTAMPDLYLLQQLVTDRGRARAIVWLTLVQTALAVGAVALTGHSDARVIAACLTVPRFVAYVLTIGYLSRVVSFPMARYLHKIGRPLVAAALMALAMMAVPAIASSLVAQVARLAAGGTVYVAVLFVVGCQSFDEVLDFGHVWLSARLHWKAAA